MTNPTNGKRDALFDIFCMEYVRLTTSSKIETQKEDQDGNIIKQVLPVQVDGYLVDFDDQFYFLSHDQESITHAIKIKNVIYVELVNETELDKRTLELINFVQDPDKMS